MTISTLDQYIAASKQSILYYKVATPALTTVAFAQTGLRGQEGMPQGTGISTIGNTTSGVVPVAGTIVGGGYFPSIKAFNVGSTGYLTKVTFAPTSVGYYRLYDMLWAIGQLNFNSNITTVSPPSFSSRIPNGDYSGTEIYLEFTSAGTAVQYLNITYTNQDGVASRTTGVYALQSGLPGTAKRVYRIPLSNGDSGVQSIQNITASNASAGTFNIMIVRPLWGGRCSTAMIGDTHGIEQTGMPIVFETSALFMTVQTDTAIALTPSDFWFEISNG